MLEGDPREWLLWIQYATEGRSGSVVAHEIRNAPTDVLHETVRRIELELAERKRLDMLARERERRAAGA